MAVLLQHQSNREYVPGPGGQNQDIYSDKYSVHKCATFGDYRDRLKDLAGLIGFTVVEEDR